jgi:hypothetical protein
VRPQSPSTPIRPRSQPAFVTEYNPDTMNEDVWATMAPEQKSEWLKYYNLA